LREIETGYLSVAAVRAVPIGNRF